MSKTGEIPYTWKQMEEEIKEAILCQASIIYEFGPSSSSKVVADFLGFEHDAFEQMNFEHIDEIDIQRHAMHYHCKVAYEYAYQTRSFDRERAFEAWHAVDGMLIGFPQSDANGEPSPFDPRNDFPLRRMLETFVARIQLFDRDYSDKHAPTIRQLSLLANMTVPATRTSLSKEGFRLDKSTSFGKGNQEESSFRLNHDDAKLWLSRRRGFIPQRSADPAEQAQQIATDLLADPAVSLPDAAARIMALKELDAKSVASSFGIDQAWLTGLLAKEAVTPDITAFRSLAQALNVPMPAFVAAGVRYVLELEASQNAEGADAS